MAALKKRAKQPEEMKFGSKGHKGVMSTHYAAEASGLKRTTLGPQRKTAKTKTKSLSKRKIEKK